MTMNNNHSSTQRVFGSMQRRQAHAFQYNNY